MYNEEAKMLKRPFKAMQIALSEIKEVNDPPDPEDAMAIEGAAPSAAEAVEAAWGIEPEDEEETQ